jgi:hypothetical protein
MRFKRAQLKAASRSFLMHETAELIIICALFFAVINKESRCPSAAPFRNTEQGMDVCAWHNNNGRSVCALYILADAKIIFFCVIFAAELFCM